MMIKWLPPNRTRPSRRFATPLFGRTGRAFLRALSERQYEVGKSHDLNDGLVAALRAWLRLLDAAQPRPISEREPRPSDVVIFTCVSWYIVQTVLLACMR